MRKRLAAGGVVMVLLAGPACGTRTDRGATLGSQAPPPSAEPGRSVPTDGAADAPGASLPATAAAPAPALPRPRASVAPTAPAKPAGEARGRATSTAAAGALPDRSDPSPRSTPPGPPGAQALVPPAAAASRSPVVIASVGTHNGPAGGAFLPVLQGAQLWAKWINDRGGLNGHPVRLVVWDDGGDPARHRAQVQEAIERRGAVAFLANTESITGRSSVDYITAKRVPVIGSEMGADWFYQSEMYFPQGSTADANWYGMVAATAGLEVPRNHTRTAVLACAESPACETLSAAVQNYGPGLGLDPVYMAKTSLAQPDFTAECLNARRVNADVVFLAMDASAISRVAASCTRQDYRPVYASTSAAVTDRLKTDAALDGMVANSPVFPYFQSGTPASDEFQAAIRLGGPDLTPGLALTAGWVAGKLLEKAAAGLGEPPAPDAVLHGLWSLQAETLGGITQPLTFTAGRPAEPRACWFTVTVVNRAWVSPDGFTRHCRNEPRG